MTQPDQALYELGQELATLTERYVYRAGVGNNEGAHDLRLTAHNVLDCYLDRAGQIAKERTVQVRKPHGH